MSRHTDLKSYLPKLLIAGSILLSVGLHWNKFSLDVQGYHTWRQSLTMINVRNFVNHDANIFNPRLASVREDGPKIVRLEFPLVQWTIAMAQKVVGEHILVARLVMFLIGIIAVLGMYRLLQALSLSDGIAATGAILFQFSAEFFYYTINPFADFAALAACVWYLNYTFRYIDKPSTATLWRAGACLGLMTLLKLPFLIISIVGVVYFLGRLFRKSSNKKELWRFVWRQMLLLLPAIAWYAWVIPTWEGTNVTFGIFDGGLTERKFWHIFRYNFGYAFPKLFFNDYTLVMATVGLLPFALKRWRASELYWYFWPQFILCVLFFAFQFTTIDTVHDYYMLMFLPWMFMLVAGGLQFAHDRLGSWFKYILVVLVALAINESYNYAHIRWDLRWSYCNEDLLVHREALRAAVPADEEVIMLNDGSLAIMPYAIGKNGHIFWGDGKNIQPLWMKDLIENKGVNYLYCDVRAFDEREDIRPFIDSTILIKESVHIYLLQLPIEQ